MDSALINITLNFVSYYYIVTFKIRVSSSLHIPFSCNSKCFIPLTFPLPASSTPSTTPSQGKELSFLKSLPAAYRLSNPGTCSRYQSKPILNEKHLLGDTCVAHVRICGWVIVSLGNLRCHYPSPKVPPGKRTTHRRRWLVNLYPGALGQKGKHECLSVCFRWPPHCQARRSAINQ